MIKLIKPYLRKIKIVFEIIRTSLRKQRKPILLQGELVRCLYSVRFLGEIHPVTILICCFKQQYWHYNGRVYVPSGIYKDWVMFYQDPSAPTARAHAIVVYPSAHQLTNVFDHYVAYLGTLTRGGYT